MTAFRNLRSHTGAAIAALISGAHLVAGVLWRKRMAIRAERMRSAIALDSMATLLERISLVLKVKPNEQVIGSHACWVVADVAQEPINYGFSAVEFPCDVRSCASASVRPSEHSVSSSKFRTAPQPASGGLFDIGPEAIRETTIVALGRLRAVLTAVLPKSGDCPRLDWNSAVAAIHERHMPIVSEGDRAAWGNLAVQSGACGALDGISIPVPVRR